MVSEIIVNMTSLAVFLPGLDTVFSTQGIMVMLLMAYAGAMWLFLTSAPKVHTIMVSDLEVARQFYEGVLNLSVAEVPLHYYYNYEQSLGATAIDPMYMSANTGVASNPGVKGSEGLWYQLRKNTQLHVITGANYGYKNRDRHVCFDHDCLEKILMQVQARRLKFKVRRTQPLNFLVKDLDERVIEMAEVSN